MMNDTLTAVPGIRVGHVTHLEGATGCTVILCPPQTVGGVDQRGGAPGTRETDLLRPVHLVSHVNAVLLAGGSAFGLAAADGVMRYLEERGEGYPVGQFVVPIVPTAILFDLNIGITDIRPDAHMGYAACLAATDQPVPQGTVGAGTGCIIAPVLGREQATKGGLGSVCIYLDDELVVAALAAVNSVGDVIDQNGRIIAGLRDSPGSDTFSGVMNIYRTMARTPLPLLERANTIIGVVATNARLTKEETNLVAQMAHDGLSRAINPAHTLTDGDTIFALATGVIPANANIIGMYAAEAMSQAIRNGVRAATSLDGVKALNHSPD
jgi:L-aminopeptidase/D-esterase-like protein